MEQWPEPQGELDLAVLVSDTSNAYAAKSGRGNIYLFHDEMARPLFPETGGPESSSLGTAGWEGAEIVETQLQAGDILVLLNPSIAEVIRVRDLTLILHRAPEPSKASLFLSAIAERKGAQGPLAAVLWEVPNYQGASLLTDEALLDKTEGGSEAAAGDEQREEAKPNQAEQAKRHWLNLWRRGKT